MALKRMRYRATAIGLMLALAACVAGKDFARPRGQDLVLGKTTYAELSQRLGPARNTGQSRINDVELDSVNYAYSESGGSALVTGVTPARSMNFYFKNGVLVGHEFSSSFAADASDFPDDRIARIEKGKSKRSDVIALLGQPTGEYTAPIVRDNGVSALGYLYTQLKMQGMSPKVHSKKLIVTLDQADIVTDVNFNAVGDR